jgi:hypothetical protein
MKWKALPIIFAVVAVTVLVGCESQQDKETRLAEQKEEEANTKEWYLEMFYREPAILLALKYKVDENKVFSLLTDEDLVYGKGISDSLDVLEGKHSTENLKERIKAYSEQYGIPTDVIASIFIDYQAISPKE